MEIRHGDTGDTPFGYGTYGSRSLAVGGMAIMASCHKVVEKARKLAAHAFEASEDDIVVDQGRYFVRGNPGEAKVLAELAFASYGAGLPEGMEHGLEAVSYFDPPNFVWPFGCHICAVEVDPETGAVSIDRYVAVDDCGNVINPMVVDGQLHGGIAQGISQALFEEVQYDDETGQMLTGTMLDYLIPTMAEMPHFELDRTVTPSPTNELGVKGIGEAGTIASSVAVINAITDALAPFGIKPRGDAGASGSPLVDDQGGTRMITAAFEYARPGSVDEAQSLLTKYGADAKVIAGGQSLIPLMRLRLSQPTALVDIQRIPGLNEVRRDNGSVEIGALVRHVDIQRNATLRETLPILVEMANDVGDNQVRNLGTIGGVIAHGDSGGRLQHARADARRRDRHQQATPPGERFLPRHLHDRAGARRGGHRSPLPGVEWAVRLHEVPPPPLRLGDRRGGRAGDRFVVAGGLREPREDAAPRCGGRAGARGRRIAGRGRRPQR